MRRLVIIAVLVAFVVATIDKAADKGPKVTTQVGESSFAPVSNIRVFRFTWILALVARRSDAL